jgi:hypothetical protein
MMHECHTAEERLMQCELWDPGGGGADLCFAGMMSATWNLMLFCYCMQGVGAHDDVGRGQCLSTRSQGDVG